MHAGNVLTKVIIRDAFSAQEQTALKPSLAGTRFFLTFIRTLSAKALGVPGYFHLPLARLGGKPLDTIAHDSEQKKLVHPTEPYLSG